MSSQTGGVDLSSLRIDRSPQPQESSRIGMWKWIVGAAVFLLLSYLGYSFFTSSSFNAIEVEIATASVVSPAQANAVLTATGYVVAQTKAALSSKATGRLMSLSVIEGDVVRKGQVIATIESSDLQAIVGQAKASVDVAKANVENMSHELDEAKKNAERQRGLRESGANTQADLDNALFRVKKSEAQVKSMMASVGVADANLRSASVQLENTVIRAPFDGTVLNKNANVGEVITALGGAAGSRGAVVTLADMNSLEVEADVNESNIQVLEENQPCEITIDAVPSKKYRGVLSKIIPTADRAKATVLTKIRFLDKDDKVLPEMRAKVLFVKSGSESTANVPSKLMIPTGALAQRKGQTVCFKRSGEKVKMVVVQTGEVQNEFVEIRTGLAAGDEVVTNPSEKLEDGSAVKVK